MCRKAFFLPTVGIYLVITIGFITIQTSNTLTLEYAYKVKQQLLYQENAFAHAQNEIEKHRSNFIQSRECLTTKNVVLDKVYDNVKVQVTSQCHKVPYEVEPDELTAEYDALKSEIVISPVKVSATKYAELKSQLTVINDLEFAEDAEDIATLVVTMGASSIEYAIDELEEMTFQDWLVYETNIKTKNKEYKILSFYNQNKKEVRKVIYTEI